MMYAIRALCALILCLVFVGPLEAKEHYTNSLQDQRGAGIASATVTVYLAGTTTLATLYSDNAGTTKANPFTTNLDGTYDFYAVNGRYDLLFVREGYTFVDAQTAGIVLFDLVDYAAGIISALGFDVLTSATNSQGALVVGSGASLSASGTGTITATGVVNDGVQLSTGTTGNYLSSATVNQGLAIVGTENASVGLQTCSNGQILKNVSGTSWACSADSTGGSPTFHTIGAGTNSTAAMVVGTGGSLATSGSGTIVASGVVADAVALTTGTTGNYVASATASQGLVMTGTEGGSLGLMVCTNNQILKNTGGASWGCAADAGGTSGFDTITSGTNTAAAMIVGAGASVTPTSTGVIAASAVAPSIVTVNAGNSPYTGLSTDLVILCDTTAANRTITLPAATTKVLYRVKNLGSFTCTVNRAGSDTIDGQTNAAIANQYVSIDLISDGVSAWSIF